MLNVFLLFGTDPYTRNIWVARAPKRVADFGLAIAYMREIVTSRRSDRGDIATEICPGSEIRALNGGSVRHWRTNFIEFLYNICACYRGLKAVKRLDPAAEGSTSCMHRGFNPTLFIPCEAERLLYLISPMSLGGVVASRNNPGYFLFGRTGISVRQPF